MAIALNAAMTDARPRQTAHRWPAKLLLVTLLALPLVSRAEDDIVLTVRPGDTLIDISQRYLDQSHRWPALKKHNRIGDELRLRPGSRLRLPVAWLHWAPGRAEVVSVQGQVLGNRGPLSRGAFVAEGEQIDTGKSGLLTLRFRDGATVAFPPGTRVRLGSLHEIPGQPLSRTAIEIESGSAESRVPSLGKSGSQFEIRSPRIVTAVRGTRFRVGADGASSRHEVLEGSVQVAGAGNRALLQPGQGVRADAGQVGAPVPLLPPPELSALPATITRTVTRLATPPLSGATAWRWQVAADADFVHLLKDEKTAQPNWVLTDLADGDLYLRLRGIDAAGIEGLDAVRPLAVRARPEPPVMLAPAPDRPVAGAAVLRWTAAEGAASTHLQIARDAEFAQVVVDQPRVSAARLTLDAPLPPGDYYWRLASRRADDYRGPFTDSVRFRQLAPSTIAAPEFDDDKLRLSWSGPDDLRYILQLAGDAEFSRPILETDVEGNRYILATPDAGTYFVRTRPLLPDGATGQWSATQGFDVPGSAPWWLLLLLLPVL